MDADVLIVGSGASAVHAAYPLAEAGLRVRMLDLGHRDTTYADLIPEAGFTEIRRGEAQQHRFFLGDRFEGVHFGQTGAGAQLTPPRQFVSRDVDTLTPVDSRDFWPIESLALGGLAGAWGAGCPPFSDVDLDGTPLTRALLEPHYDAVAERIGISGARDELLPYLGDLEAMQPPVDIDSNAETILRRYHGRRERLNRQGFFIGRPRLAMLSRDHRGRSAQAYRDMDFWCDHGKSVYRPRWTLDELTAMPGFEYRDGILVDRFAEDGDGRVQIETHDPRTGEAERHVARKAILAAGTLGTARIVLRSMDCHGRRVPLVCNPHTYAAMINLNMLGKPARDERHSLAQLCFVHAPDGATAPTTVGHVYSYRSLHLFRLAKDSPLPAPQSLGIFRLLVSSLTLLIVQHADGPSPAKHCSLEADPSGGPDRLQIDYALSDAERRRADGVEKEILSAFRSLGCVPLRRVRPGHAASVHYAGTFPMTTEPGELTTDVNARLRATRSVHLADGSVFGRLPSRGLTFTMMAHADRVGSIVRDSLL